MQTPSNFIRRFFSRVKLTILATVLGLYFSLGGAWLCWDIYTWSLQHNPYIEGKAWSFYSPMFWLHVDSTRSSLPFDIGVLMIFLLGIPLLMVASYEAHIIEEKVSR